MPLSFSELQETATREGTEAFRAAVAAFPGETFYAFCFYSNSDVSSVYPHAITVEGLRRRDTHADPNYFKWNPAEWQLDFGQYGDSPFMRQTNELLQRRGDGTSFGDTKRQVIAALSAALLAIKGAGVFDGHADLQNLVCWVHIGDVAGEEEWMFEPVIDAMPAEIVEELRQLFEFTAQQKQRSS